MHLNKNNLYVMKHGVGFVVCIEMPDKSRNYLHNKPSQRIDDAVMIKGSFDGDYELGFENTSVISDEKYYRIVVVIEDGCGKKQRFHSRKLNVSDAQKEFEMLVY